MIRAGQLISGRYRLDERLGFGGMGEVWRATDVFLGRSVALKVLRPDIADDPEFRRRFWREARTLAALNADGIVRLHDFGHDTAAPGPVTYLVMEYVPGRTLGELAPATERMPPAVVLPMLSRVARSLGVAHRAGIVHRDIKPGNIIVGADGQATLVDFGIAHTPGQTRHTDADQIIGTLGYASPEQLHGDPLTPASDVYALGAVAYRLLSGTPLFDGGTATVIAGHLHRPPPHLPPGTPPGVGDVVMRALAKTPAERYRSGTELADALDAALNGGRPARPGPSRVRSLRVIAAGLAVAALVAVLVLTATLLPRGTSATIDPGASAPPGATASLADGTLIDSGGGVIYRLGGDGVLSWYRHTDPDGGAATWAEGAGRVVAEGWDERIASVGCDGVLYSLDRSGRLYWYHDLDPARGGEWSPGSGGVLRTDFGRFTRLLAGPDGSLYGIEANGDLFWYRHTSPDDGPVTWDPRSGTNVGSGWDPSKAAAVGGCDGVYYVIRPDGTLSWVELAEPEGTYWAYHVSNLAVGWSRFSSIIGSRSGVIYARAFDGDLYWFRLRYPDVGVGDFVTPEGKLIADNP